MGGPSIIDRAGNNNKDLSSVLSRINKAYGEAEKKPRKSESDFDEEEDEHNKTDMRPA